MLMKRQTVEPLMGFLNGGILGLPFRLIASRLPLRAPLIAAQPGLRSAGPEEGKRSRSGEAAVLRIPPLRNPISGSFSLFLFP
jgi:hypothetical protein